MCGIVGLFGPAAAGASEDVEHIARRMACALRHRGPDDDGLWLDAEAAVALGHRRLAIIDVSPEGRQPMASACGRYVLSYNGEIYNYADLRAQLERAGHRFRGHSDTEILLGAIAEWGLDAAIAQSNGMFALALWDRRERVLSLARDRFGQKPLYYGLAGGTFVFASELKAFDAVPGFERAIDREALALYLRHAYVPEPWCIWSGLHKLAPGALLRVSAQDVARKHLPPAASYWSPLDKAREAAAKPLVDETQALEELEVLLRDSVRLCMVSDVPLGALLSGGIDSSAVVALMQAQTGDRVRTFTIGFHESGFDEASSARRVAEHLGTDHTELYLTHADARDVIPLLPSIYDEPFADSSQIPTYLVSQLARRSVTVSLSGDGGDELFGGYVRYLMGGHLARGIGAVPRAARRIAAGAMRKLPVSAWDRASGVLPRRLRYSQAGDKAHKLADVVGADSPEQAYWRLTSHWHAPDDVLAQGREPATVLSDVSRWPATGGFVQRMMVLDAATYLPGDILVKLDRASMAVSLEARAPLLDHRLAEFAWRLPLSMKIRNGSGKWLLRELLQRYLPRALTERPKAGFAIPLGDWLRGPLRPWAEALLDEARLRADGYFRPEPIRQRWAEHLAGRRNWQDSLWAVLMFQAWLDRQAAVGKEAPGHETQTTAATR